MGKVEDFISSLLHSVGTKTDSEGVFLVTLEDVVFIAQDYYRAKTHLYSPLKEKSVELTEKYSEKRLTNSD